MLCIKYDKESHLVQLSLINNNLAWIDIRRLCEEQSNKDEITYTSASSLEIPWWRFIIIRSDLRYLIVKHKLDIDIDLTAKKLMTKALEKQKMYERARDIDPMPLDEIQTRLKQVGFKRELKPFQLNNVSRIANLPSGATFSVPGGGKTTEALAFYYLNKKENSKLLIIAPKNAFPAWDEQISECVINPPKIIRLTGGYDSIKEKLNENPSIVMITYHQLPGVVSLVADYMSKNQFFVFVDESHRMKRGYKGTHGRSILSLSNIPEYKLILSGTPMPQSSEDLIPQFNFLFPEVRVDKDSVIQAIDPIYVRTTKDDLKLKKPRIELAEVEMKPSQRRLYELLRSEAARQAEELLKVKDKLQLRKMGKSVLRLIQLTSNPALLAKTDFKNNPILRDILKQGDSPKIQYVCNRVRQLSSEKKKTIVWSSFVENVEVLSQRLADLGSDYIHGGVDVGDEEDFHTREYKIKRFHEDPNAFVLIANPAAASEGISLHKVCHNAIYLDRNYNAAQFLQSMDRIHRVGLPEDVETLIEVVVCPETIDESVNRRLELKINSMSEVLNDASLRYEYEYADEETEEEISENDIHDAINHLLGKEIN